MREQLINVPGRRAASGGKITLHLPKNWAWAEAWQHLYDQARALLLNSMRAGPPTHAAP